VKLLITNLISIKKQKLSRHLFLDPMYSYLHHYATPTVIHRNIKASNILLDDSLDALVADFGLAKLIPEGSLPKGSSKGISGYAAPNLGKVSESCDVFSFGILLMELISGRKPFGRVGGEKQAIMEWAGPLVLEGRFRDLVDEKLEGKFHQDDLIRLVQVLLADFSIYSVYFSIKV
jgi:serine/threonine protein kinase